MSKSKHRHYPSNHFLQQLKTANMHQTQHALVTSSSSIFHLFSNVQLKKNQLKMKTYNWTRVINQHVLLNFLSVENNNNNNIVHQNTGVNMFLIFIFMLCFVDIFEHL